MKIFLSHLSRDKATVGIFRKKLPPFLTSWIDEDSLCWSDSLDDKIRDAVTASADFVLLFVARDTLNSEWVKKELNWALRQERLLRKNFVFPIILQAGADETLPSELAGRLFLTLPDFQTHSVEDLANRATLKLFQIVAERYSALASPLSGTAPALRLVIDQALNGGYEATKFWTRPMLCLPLEDGVSSRILKVLRNAQQATAAILRRVVPEANAKHVRANIFLPTSDRVREGDVCTLAIPTFNTFEPTRLQINMDNDRELAIAFRPQEGATGRVFSNRRAIGVVTHPKWLAEKDKDARKSMERWVYVGLSPSESLEEAFESLRSGSGKKDFEMRDFHNRLADEMLTWIISMPLFLMIDGRPEVVGVFNIDSVEIEIRPDLLRRIFYEIVPFAGAISGIVRGLPTDRVAIFKVSGEFDDGQ